MRPVTSLGSEWHWSGSFKLSTRWDLQCILLLHLDMSCLPFSAPLPGALLRSPLCAGRSTLACALGARRKAGPLMSLSTAQSAPQVLAQPDH